MSSPKPRISGPGVAAAIGAGLTAALFSMLVAQKTPLALAMGFIAPLPIMIAALGFGSVAGLIAVAVGAVAVGIFDLRPEGLTLVLPGKALPAWLDLLGFIVGLGVPSWLLSRLAVALSGRPPEGAPSLPTARRPEETRLGHLMAVAVGFAAIGVALDFAVAMTKQGGFTAFMTTAIAKAEPLARSLIEANRFLPKPADVTKAVHEIAVAATWAQMPQMAGAAVVLLLFNLWLAGRIAQTSGLLSGPWPDIARHTRMPRPLALALAVVLGLSFAGGLVGMLSLIVSGALVMGFALQGLAVLHFVTRGKSYRLPLLILVYLLVPWLIAFWGVIGLLDTAFAFRDRAKKPTPKPGPWQPPPKDH